MDQAQPNKPTSRLLQFFLEYKKLFLLLSLPVLVGLVAIVGLGVNKQQQPVKLSDNAMQVDIKSTGFVPQTLKVKKGQVVSWINVDTTPHRLKADADKLESFETVDMLNKGDSYTYIFDRSGTFNYYDPDNPLVLVGNVVVSNE